MKLEWSDFKAIVIARSLSIQWIQNLKDYQLTIADGPMTYTCSLDREPDRDQTRPNYGFAKAALRSSRAAP